MALVSDYGQTSSDYKKKNSLLSGNVITFILRFTRKETSLPLQLLASHYSCICCVLFKNNRIAETLVSFRETLYIFFYWFLHQVNSTTARHNILFSQATLGFSLIYGVQGNFPRTNTVLRSCRR